jgi:hypothetical protein
MLTDAGCSIKLEKPDVGFSKFMFDPLRRTVSQSVQVILPLE